MNRIVIVIEGKQHDVYHEIGDKRVLIGTFDNFDKAWECAYSERHNRGVTHGLDIERIK